MVLIASSDSQSTISLPIQKGDSSSNSIGKFFYVTDAYEIAKPAYVFNFGKQVRIIDLPGKTLSSPILAFVRYDETHYLAECIEVPIYAIGNSMKESLSNLKEQLLELYDELKDDDELSDEWLKHKSYLKGIIK